MKDKPNGTNQSDESSSENEEDTLKDVENTNHIPRDQDYFSRAASVTSKSLDIQTIKSEDYDDDNWHSLDSDENEENKVGRGRVRFQEQKGLENRLEDFSPPRIPRNSPSYMIWNQFTKEREDRKKTKQSKVKGKNGSKRSGSPLSEVALNGGEGDLDFHNTLLNAKLTELEKEITQFRKENTALQHGRRKLQGDKKKLAQEIEEFKRQQESEKKKLEDDKKRLRRDRMLLEKSNKEKRSEEERKLMEEFEDLQAKVKYF